MKLITWNIQWGRGADSRVDLARIVAHARRLADFDVLCLQEVSAGDDRLPGGDGGDHFQRLAALLPDHELVTGVATDTPGWNWPQPRWKPERAIIGPPPLPR